MLQKHAKLLFAGNRVGLMGMNKSGELAESIPRSNTSHPVLCLRVVQLCVKAAGCVICDAGSPLSSVAFSPELIYWRPAVAIVYVYL